MTITLNINNPYYQYGLEDMAATAGVPLETLCIVLIAKMVEEFDGLVKQFKQDTLKSMIRERGDANA